MHTCLLTYALTPWSRVILEKPTGSQLVKNFPAFYGTRRFMTAFTSARQLSLSWASSIQSIHPHPTSWRSILIFILPPTPGSSKWSNSLRFLHHNPVYTFHLPLSATCPAHLIFLDFITRTIFCEAYSSLSPSLWNFLYSPVTSSLLGPNILLGTLYK